MKRYKFLRGLGLNLLSAAALSVLNRMHNYPPDTVWVMCTRLTMEEKPRKLEVLEFIRTEDELEAYVQARIIDAKFDMSPIYDLINKHEAIKDQNEQAYFELAYHRATGWMAWITDKPLCVPPVANPGRKILARGQGHTAQEACADAVLSLSEDDA